MELKHWTALFGRKHRSLLQRVFTAEVIRAGVTNGIQDAAIGEALELARVSWQAWREYIKGSKGRTQTTETLIMQSGLAHPSNSIAEYSQIEEFNEKRGRHLLSQHLAETPERLVSTLFENSTKQVAAHASKAVSLDQHLRVAPLTEGETSDLIMSLTSFGIDVLRGRGYQCSVFASPILQVLNRFAANKELSDFNKKYN